MAQLMTPFDANAYNPAQSSGSLPVGKHPVIIESSEVKANSKNDGGYLQLNLKVIDGPATGSMGAYRLNLYNNSAQTVEIAHKQMSAVCHVVGVFNVSDSSQLHNIPFIVDVVPQKGDTNYTEVKKVYDINGNEPGKQGQPKAAQPMQQQPVQQGHPTPEYTAETNRRIEAAGVGGTWQSPPKDFGQQPVQQQAPAQGGWGQPQQQAPVQQAAPAWGGQQNPPQTNAPWGAK